jgi:hypothetical protein
MTQIFSPLGNTVARVVFYGSPIVVALVLVAWYMIVNSPYSTEVGVVREQPVPFSHLHHASGLGIDCRFCHTSVEKSAFAGMPSTEICMHCHSHIWRDSPMLEPVRASYRTGDPLEWRRVHDLPDFVFFNHSIHVNKGIGCESCHGRVDLMPLTWKTQTLYMDWCLGCHREPEKHMRSRDEIFKFGVALRPLDERRELAVHYGVPSRNLTDCYVCHR